VRLSVPQWQRIVAHCYHGLPDEACGLLAGPMVAGEPTGLITEVYPSRDAEDRGEEIVGVWHSHTHTDPFPSPTDVDRAVDPAWIYVIVSLRDEAPMLRAFRIRAGAVAECRVVLEAGAGRRA
jgi:proteasome lid subunit RPN8/RPN11